MYIFVPSVCLCVTYVGSGFRTKLTSQLSTMISRFSAPSKEASYVLLMSVPLCTSVCECVPTSPIVCTRRAMSCKPFPGRNKRGTAQESRSPESASTLHSRRRGADTRAGQSRNPKVWPDVQSHKHTGKSELGNFVASKGVGTAKGALLNQYNRQYVQLHDTSSRNVITGISVSMRLWVN